ncbi:hypothetical protein Ppha_1984 [Pelodictyon phaeoclathratiforme BU-1]|uniref:Uncharacterized protein n=1 Tax=Pelodictyon phaeoclathratiforme (strain DSM 5477 / BU-1) TaxID=324925 RepID=B4SCJ1_PELPB|nr:hypothetical protein Ppha_1984 [Pelodictyon phaeoclathratiforme BU-1]
MHGIRFQWFCMQQKGRRFVASNEVFFRLQNRAARLEVPSKNTIIFLAVLWL